MERILILLAGYPATGKSYLLGRIQERFGHQFESVALDDFKERLWDEVGFDSAEEKAELEKEIYRRYYECVRALMGRGVPVVLDYVFSDKQKGVLAKYADEFDYRVMTIRLVGDPVKIYERSLSRDLAPTRHLGHLVSRYHPGDSLEDRSKADALVSRETFLDRCSHKGYQYFELGTLLEVDATDVSAIDYGAILDRIEEFVAGAIASGADTAGA